MPSQFSLWPFPFLLRSHINKENVVPAISTGSCRRTHTALKQKFSSDHLFCYSQQPWFLKIGTEALPGQVDGVIKQTKQGTRMEIRTACGCQGGGQDTLEPEESYMYVQCGGLRRPRVSECTQLLITGHTPLTRNDASSNRLEH